MIDISAPFFEKEFTVYEETEIFYEAADQFQSFFCALTFFFSYLSRYWIFFVIFISGSLEHEATILFIESLSIFFSVTQPIIRAFFVIQPCQVKSTEFSVRAPI